METTQDLIVELTDQPAAPAPSVVVSSRRHSGHVGRWRMRAVARMGAEGLKGGQRLKPNPLRPVRPLQRLFGQDLADNLFDEWVESEPR